MADRGSEPNAQSNGVLSHEEQVSYSTEEPTQETPQNPLVNSSEGLNASKPSPTSSGSSFVKELRTEEAELAAVIAKVTGRASPFVNESDGGGRKFTILCGDAAKQEGESSGEVTTSLHAGFSVDEKLFVASSGVQFSGPPILNETGNVVLPTVEGVVHKGAGDETEISVLENGCIHENGIDGEKQNGYATDVEETKANKYLKTEQPLPSNKASLDKEPENTEDTFATANKKIDTEGNLSAAETGILSDDDNDSAVDVGFCTPKEEDFDPTNQSHTSGDNLETSERMDKGPTERETPPPKTDTVKACFPSVKSKVPAKSFEITSPEVQQNIINRRMAARNATAIAEFDPLVTLSPEAHKLVMWTSTMATEKKSIYEPDESIPSIPDSPMISTQISVMASSVSNVHTPPSSGKDAIEETTKASQKQLPSPVSTQKKMAIEEDTKNNSSIKKDTELGDKDIVYKYECPNYKHWIFSLAMIVLIPIAIFVPLMLISFAVPLWENEPGENHYDREGSIENLPDASPKVFQELLKKVVKDKAMQDHAIESNALSEQEDIFDGAFSVSEGMFPENDDFHDEDDRDQDMTSFKGKNKDKNLLLPSLLAEENLQDFDSKSKNVKTVCSSLEDNEGEVLCQKLKPSVLKLVFKYIKRCQKSGDIALTDYIQMYRYINSFFSNLGGFAAIQTKMLEERLKELEELTLGEHASDYQKLFQMIYYEVTSGIVAKMEPFSGTIILTCLHRHLQFLTLALTNVLYLEREASLQLAFEAAYKKVLLSHHTWFVELIYEVGMNMLPTKIQAATLLSIRQVEKFSLDELMESLVIVVAQLNELNAVTESVLIETNALEVIPKQVIA